MQRACVQGRCGSTSATITVTITDSCPQCEANHIDIQALTFNVVRLPLSLPVAQG